MRHKIEAPCLAVAACLAVTGATLAQNGLVNWESPHVHPIDLTPSGARLLAVNTADNRLEVFDVSQPGGIPILERVVPVGLDPVSVRARSDSEAWVVNRISDSISVVDLSSGRVVRTIQTGDEPADVVFAGSPPQAFVTVSQLNQVRVFDPENPTTPPVVMTIEGEHPKGLAVSPDGSHVYVAIFESGNATGAVRQQDVSNPTGPYGGQNPPPNSDTLFDPPIANGLPTPPPVSQIVRRDPVDGHWRDNNGRDWSQFVAWNVHDHDVATIDTATLGVSYQSGIMTTVMGIAVRPDGLVSVVGTEAKNEIRFGPNVKSVFIRCEIGSFDPLALTPVNVADLNPHLTYSGPSVPLTQRLESLGDPRAIVWHPTSGLAYVAGMGSSDVVAVDTTGARFAQIPVGDGPTGLALTAAGDLLYVMNKFEGSVSVIDTVAGIETARVPFFDPTPAAIKIGRPLLYDTHSTSGLGQAACASCHVDARSDFLAWDVGDPQGTMKTVDQPCRQPACRPWHPMKGPMITQTLQGIVGTEPLHWRGDREDIASFSVAYVDLLGLGEEPSEAEMDALRDFIATIQYQPNPNLNLDGSLPTAFPTSTGINGNPATGETLFMTLPVLTGGSRCVDCHALPTGTTQHIEDPRIPQQPQAMKMVQLRGLWETDGWRKSSQNNSKSFGFNHNSEFDSVFALLGSTFSFTAGATGQQQRRDLETYLMCFSTETHAAVGQQVTFDGTNNDDPTLVARLNTFASLADAGKTGLIAKGRRDGIDRGYVYAGSGAMQSDRLAEVATVSQLRIESAAGAEMTFTVVPLGTERRIGVDRDSDGYYDQDELDAGTKPDDPSSVPGQCEPYFVMHPAATQVCLSSEITLQVSVASSTETTFQWTKDGVPLVDGPTGSGSSISGATTATLIISGSTVVDDGAYACVATSTCGTSTSHDAAVVICGADLVCDGLMDFSDYLEFLNLYDAGDLRVDYNDDGLVDFSDYLEFLTRYDTGC